MGIQERKEKRSTEIEQEATKDSDSVQYQAIFISIWSPDAL